MADDALTKAVEQEAADFTAMQNGDLGPHDQLLGGL
jgi:hypothetical protein